MQNLNETLFEKHKQDFNTALNIYENSYSHENLIELLENGSIAEKQAATIKLDNILSQKEADIFISNLTGCDGKIREAVSFRLKEFLPQNTNFYTHFTDTFLDAIIDINGNICRNIIEAIQPLKKSDIFLTEFCPKLIQKTAEIIPPIKAFDIQEGKYKINKEVFKLYWYLETISEFADFVPETELYKILIETKDINDYTIREKTAKILSKTKNSTIFINIKTELKHDQNYYVRRI